ncbi:hypothetical protein [Rufibacter hautae]|uniref:Uncharacterized protein n=1 Tax=Rufibacter hautae TaxID=2595005 RepID=A0A5B6TAW8_9BACT|nr:hypothetical protein [Rufibacter hautae]KAA3436720.1 hypothetical protein FOA19_20290 [Rufibacter hautae]
MEHLKEQYFNEKGLLVAKTQETTFDNERFSRIKNITVDMCDFIQHGFSENTERYTVIYFPKKHSKDLFARLVVEYFKNNNKVYRTCLSLNCTSTKILSLYQQNVKMINGTNSL